jgi:CBS domain-containing protein
MDETIKDVMHRGVVTCKVSTTADKIVRTMVDNDVAALVVVDERLDTCGLVTKTDLVQHCGEDLSAITAEDIMTFPLLYVSPDATVREAVEQMVARKVHQVVVVTQADAHRRPVGIFTSGDVLALMSRTGAGRGRDSTASVSAKPIAGTYPS